MCGSDYRHERSKGRFRMNLLDDIRNDLVSESASLPNTLRKAKILASQIGLPKFKEWLDSELGGYADEDRIPNYRKFQAGNLGKFSGPFGSGIKNMPIPTSHLPDPVREYAENLILSDGVGALEGILSQGSSEGLGQKWPQEFVLLARDSLQMNGGMMVLVDAHKPVPLYIITGILDKVKTKLLDFILAMQESDITLENLNKDAEETRVVHKIFNNTIYGDNNVIASGENVRQKVTPVVKGDIDSLLSRFRELGIDDESLRELKDAVASEPSVQNGNFGPKARAWIGGMIEKVPPKAWEIGIDALKSFYGL